MLLVFSFAITNVATATTEEIPLVWVLQNSLSTAGTMAITALMFVLLIMTSTSLFASTSRQAFAFARDDGLPFSAWMKKVVVLQSAPRKIESYRYSMQVVPSLNVAANACYVTWGYTVIMSLIYLGSRVAFNAM